MALQPTTIACAPTLVAPTRMSGQAGGSEVAAAPSPVRVSAIPGTAVRLPATSLPVADPAPEPVTVAASALPGERRVTEVAMTELSAFFPVATLCSLERVRAVLQGVHYEAQGAVAWLQFGAEVQTEVADLVARRLSLLEAEPVRATPKHLARLQGLLADVAAGFDGGFLRTPGRAVWAKHLPEIRQLETLLEQGERALIAALASLRELLELSRGCSEQLEAYLLASDWLSKKAPSVAASRVLARQQALAGSKALLLEHLLLLGQDEARLEDLVHLTRDGVQLRLPAVHALLSSTPDRPSDTQRFLATEKLNELVQLIERKKSWL